MSSHQRSPRSVQKADSEESSEESSSEVTQQVTSKKVSKKQQSLPKSASKSVSKKSKSAKHAEQQIIESSRRSQTSQISKFEDSAIYSE